VASRFDTARRFHGLLSSEPDVTCPYVPDSNILCFRIGDGDQLALRERVLAGGRLHFGSTTVNGERYLRLVITAPDTDDDTLQELLRELRAGPVACAA
jgi:L-2,4-diaminobutyrate decarboxylase